MQVKNALKLFSNGKRLNNESEFLSETCCDYIAATVQALVRGIKFEDYRNLFNKEENGEIRLYSRTLLGVSSIPQVYERLKVSPVIFNLNLYLTSGKSLFHAFVVFGNKIMDSYIHIRKVEVREFDFELFNGFLKSPSVEIWNRLFKVNFRGQAQSLRIKARW
jgi:hypothetical protein